MPFKTIDAAGGLTHQRLLEAVRYDPHTGKFWWMIPGCGPGGGGCRGVGRPAGRCSKAGYVRLSIDGVRYRAHRLAWYYMTGAWPTQQIDHKNGIRSDNRWENLREATQQQNSANMMRPRPPSGTPKGVFRYHNPKTGTVRYRAHIMVDGRSIYLGTFLDQDEAAAAYRSAAVKHFGQFARAA